MKPTVIQIIYLCCLLLLSGITVLSCATKEMETLEPFQNVLEDFLEIAELPEIVEEDPGESLLDDGLVVVPDQTQAILNELAGWVEVDDFSAETWSWVGLFSKVLETEEEISFINSVDEAKLAAVFRDNNELDPGIEAFIQKMKGIPELGALLPSFSYPKIDGKEFREMLLEETGPVEVIKPMGKPNSPPGKPPGNPPGAPPVVNPPCRNAAEKAHREAWDQLDMQRETQEDFVLKMFETRVASYQAARDERITAFMDSYNMQRTSFAKQTQLILQISNQLNALGQTAAAKQLKVIAIIPVNATVQLESLKKVALNAIVQTQRNNTAAATITGNKSINSISQNFSDAALDLQKKLDKALSRCLHNQGGGN